MNYIMDYSQINKVINLECEIEDNLAIITAKCDTNLGHKEFSIAKIHKDFKNQGSYTYLQGRDSEKEYKTVKPVLKACEKWIEKINGNNDYWTFDFNKVFYFTGIKKEKQTKENKIEQEKETQQNNSIKYEYIVGNRCFNTYAEASQYCLECDFDPDLMIETKKENSTSGSNTASSIDTKIKNTKIKINILENKINRLEEKRYLLTTEINNKNIKLNDKSNYLINNLIDLDALINSIESKIDILRENLKQFKTIQYKLYIKSLKQSYGNNKYKIVNRNTNDIIYSNKIDAYLNNFNYNIFAFINNNEVNKQVYTGSEYKHKHYNTDIASYLKNCLEVNCYNNNDTDLKVVKHYYIDRNNNIMLIEENIKKNRIKLHYMKCIMGNHISINNNEVWKNNDIYNECLTLFKDNNDIYNILIEAYNKHAEYIKNYKKPTFEDKKNIYIKHYEEIINKFSKLKEVADNLKYYSDLYKNNTYKFYKDFNTNKENFSNYLFNYNELNRLKELKCNDYSFVTPKEVVYTRKYRK